MGGMWREIVRDAIMAKLLEIEAQAALLEEPIDIKNAIKQVNAAYPFVGRHSHPYRIWLSEMKVAKEFLKAKPRRQARFYECFSKQVAARKLQKTNARIVAPGQTSLFEETT